MTYSPPGYLTFEELFKKASAYLFSGKEQPHSHILRKTTKSYDHILGEYDKHIIYDYDEENRLVITELLANEDPSKISELDLVRKEMHLWSEEQLKTVTLKYNSYQNDTYTFISNNGQQWNFDKNAFELIVCITKTWKIIRDALCSTIKTENDEPFSFLQHNGKEGSIPNAIWMNDDNWYALICDGELLSEYAVSSIYPNEPERKVVYFDEKLADKILAENAVIPLNQITSNFIQKANDGSIAFRAAERLYQLFKITHPVEFTHGKNAYKIIENTYNKVTLIDFITDFAKRNEFKVVSPQNEKDYDIETSVSKQDIDAIATLLRTLSQQERRPKKKVT